jgi:uncharacterized protein (DUF488 family)
VEAGFPARSRANDFAVNHRPRIWTIGHSTRRIGEFIDLLRANGIRAIADIRAFPASRRHPQFNGPALAAALAEAGVAYEHFPELGGRRRPRPDSRNTRWRHDAFRGYADYMETPEFAAGAGRLADLARREPTAAMCAEALWWKCHRAVLSDWLKWKGWAVLHIDARGRAEEHPFTSAAQMVDGALSYAQEGLFRR